MFHKPIMDCSKAAGSRVPLPHVQASRHSAELRASAALLFSVVLASREHIMLLTVVLRLCILSIGQKGEEPEWK